MSLWIAVRSLWDWVMTPGNIGDSIPDNRPNSGIIVFDMSMINEEQANNTLGVGWDEASWTDLPGKPISS